MKVGYAACVITCLVFQSNQVNAASNAQSAALTIVRPLPGFKCMQLKPRYESYDPDRDIEIPILEQPRKTARSVVISDGLILVKTPTRKTRGFIQVLCPDMRLGWIEMRYITKWRVAGSPGVSCIPVVMSNGYPSATYKKHAETDR